MDFVCEQKTLPEREAEHSLVEVPRLVEKAQERLYGAGEVEMPPPPHPPTIAKGTPRKGDTSYSKGPSVFGSVDPGICGA